MSLPGADELFRRTGQAAHSVDAGGEPRVEPGVEAGVDAGVDRTAGGTTSARPPLAAAPAPVEPAEVDPGGAHQVARAAPVPDGQSPGRSAPPRRTASGRVRHDEKMTVYVTADELLEVEHARLVLRRSLGSAVDRGRLVRAAVAMALADLDEHGDDSELVRRLRDA